MSDIWTQTFITVVPKSKLLTNILRHHDVEVREIRPETKISAYAREPFTISTEDFIFEPPIEPKKEPEEPFKPPIKHFIDPAELERKPTKNAENQTFLQGVPTVIIPIELKDEVSQTMYMRDIHPPQEYILLITSLNGKPPVFKSDCSSQTEIGIFPEVSHDKIPRYLSSCICDKLRIIPQEDIIDSKIISYEVINFLLSRTLWISDPDLYQIPIETTCQEIQTVIRYNLNTDSIMMDSEIQTKLTCQPSDSHSKLLMEYKETKNFIRTFLRECMKGIETRIVIDELIDEIIMKGVDTFKKPTCDQASQTVASYISKFKEKDVLQKLNIPMVIDPLEASTVVVPLMNNIVNLAYKKICQNIKFVINDILNLSLQQAVLIGIKKTKIHLRPTKTIEEILCKRKCKLIEIMSKKKTESVTTQTGLAGIPVVKKIKEDILCTVRSRKSICEWCRAVQEDCRPVESTKVLRTQDILLAYKPCYVIASASEEAKNPHLKSIASLKKERKICTQPPPTTPCTCVISEKIGDAKTINMLMTPKKPVQDQDSLSQWTRIIDDTLIKSWSFKESTVNDETNVTITSFATTSISKSCYEETPEYKSVPNLQVTDALQILKNTFCTRDTPAKALTRNCLFDNNKEYMSCNVDNCTLLYSKDECATESIDKIDYQICARPRADKCRTAQAWKFCRQI